MFQNMFSFYFYTYWRCTYHFSSFLPEISIYFYGQTESSEKLEIGLFYVGMIMYQCMFLKIDLKTHESPLGTLLQARTGKQTGW